jgi:hypothetical protein
LIFEHQKKKPHDFILPEGFASPRGVHDVDARQHWWNQVRGFPETMRKHPAPQSDPSQERSASSGFNTSVPRSGATKSGASRNSMMRRSTTIARLQSGMVANNAKQIARAVSRCSISEGKLTASTANPSKRWSLAAIEKSEMRTQKEEKVGMSTQDLLERSRNARATRQRSKTAKKDN